MLFVFGTMTSGSDAYAGTAIDNMTAFLSLSTSSWKNSCKHGKYTWLIHSFMWSSVTVAELTLMSKSRNGINITDLPDKDAQLDGELDPELAVLELDAITPGLATLDKLAVLELELELELELVCDVELEGSNELVGFSKQNLGKLFDAGFKNAAWKVGDEAKRGDALRAW
jgi:hypothetical protein